MHAYIITELNDQQVASARPLNLNPAKQRIESGISDNRTGRGFLSHPMHMLCGGVRPRVTWARVVLFRSAEAREVDALFTLNALSD